jgi:hypothetical protein
MAWRETYLAPAADKWLELFDQMKPVQRIRPLLAVDRLACAHAVRQLAVVRSTGGRRTLEVETRHPQPARRA